MSSPQQALHELLVEHFTVEQLRRVLTHFHPKIAEDLPSGPAKPGDFTFEATEALRRRRLVGAELFAALVSENPDIHTHISTVAAAFGLPPPPSPQKSSAMPPTPKSAPHRLVLEFSRTQRAADPYSFDFRPQTYTLRSDGGELEESEFPWTPEVLADLQHARNPNSPPEILHRLGHTLRTFLARAGWTLHENTILTATRAHQPIDLTIRSSAAELYAVPWELLTLKGPGQFLGSLPGLVIRYEWPGTKTAPDRTPGLRRGRVLFAWSAATRAVPAGPHLAALQAAFRALPGSFDPSRDVLAHASLAGLRDALTRAGTDGQPIDALHILCHGGPIGETCGLVLDDGSGGFVTVDAGRLQQILAPHADMLRMVVVAACESSTYRPGNHLASVAQMLHRAGIPAVVGARTPLSTAGSIQFTEAFYAALVADRKPVEQAFLAARDTLAADATHRDWSSLQLYGRESDSPATRPLQLPVTPPAASTSRAGPPGPSPFLVGAPILKDADFFGRKHECGVILDAIEKGLPIQILGGALVGKSSLLRWVQRHLPAGRPVVWISAQGFSPIMLVAAIARELGHTDTAAALEKKSTTLHDAKQRLAALGEFSLLLDEADKLATSRKKYDEGFFELVRGLVESRKLTWISASRRDLYEVFKQQGLTSRFLNSAKRIWLGPLDDQSARELASLGAPEHVESIVAEAGGFAFGIQWLGDTLLQAGANFEEYRLEFRREMKRRAFQSWWDAFPPDEQAVLKRCATASVSPEDDIIREVLNELREKGLVHKMDGAYHPAPGNAWREFVNRGG